MRSSKNMGGGVVSPSHLISALEELARKRREFTSAIVTLASIAGVDAAPYLDGLGTIPGDAPPRDDISRPQRPASPVTNGTGRAHTVSEDSFGATTARVLRVLTNDPQSPRALGQQLKLPAATVGYHLKKLAQAKLAQLSGVGKGRVAQLRA